MIPGISQRLLSDQSEADDVGVTQGAFRGSGVEDTIHTIEWGDGASSGSIAIEVADSEAYTGKWTLLQTMTLDASVDPAPKTDTVRISGSYGAFRHRIVNPITDGTVTSKIRGYV